MKNAVLADDMPDENYVVEIDGRIESKHEVFVEALKAGLNFKQKCPLSNVKVRDANENTQADEKFSAERTRKLALN